MNRIECAFYNKKAFIGFITGGDPDLETTEELIYAMEEGGADIIEIGVPFSDPIAEGIVIQEANERALKAGTTMNKLFELIEKVRQKTQIPIVLLTYMNPVFLYGIESFLNRCSRSGVDGLIIPDLPYEERWEVEEYAVEYDVALIRLVAPTSKERIKKIAEGAKGFIYCVSSLGVTGIRSEVTMDAKEMCQTIRSITDTPCAVGFGIATEEQARNVATIADGVIVGSAIVKLVGEYKTESPQKVYEYVRKMSEAVQSSDRMLS